MARPQVYSDEEMVAALEEKHGLVFLAAKSLGCSPDTIRHRAKQSPAVAGCILAQRGRVIDTAEERLFEAVDKGQPWAVGLMLKTLGRDRGYVERSEHRLGGEPGVGPVGHRVEAGANNEAIASPLPPPDEMDLEDLELLDRMFKKYEAQRNGPQVIAGPAVGGLPHAGNGETAPALDFRPPGGAASGVKVRLTPLPLPAPASSRNGDANGVH
jgi:hypothetical protein